MKLTLGFSPCPNDTFIFDAMVHGRVDTEGIEFDYFLADVEELNRRAFSAEPDITKMSFHAYAYAARDYFILDSGSALGYGSGPLLVSRNQIETSSIPGLRIAIPGKYTTANLIFSIAWPDAKDKQEYLFSDIVKAIVSGEVDAGLIIHETRFTYQKSGLHKIADLGQYWEELTSLPIPLGTIVINRRIALETALKVNRVIRRSIEFASNNSAASTDFIAENAKETDKDVISKHIELYVNEYSLDLGANGRNAIRRLFDIAYSRRVIPKLPERIFLTPD